MRKLVGLFLVAGLVVALSGSVLAAEGTAFVCPVFNDQAAVGMHNPNAFEIAGGDYSLLPGNSQGLMVPDGATNDDGAGSPSGDHLAPGDPGYTAIWAGH